MAARVPVVEIADYADDHRVRRPHCETRPLHAVHRLQMRAQSPIRLVMRAFL